ncbi:hypothetical protein [Oceanicola sp. S124]|uniref:hypothetical protein n=1 Tax=Oceanicola sp. S124 TaxID=1042378 RepID=UPI0002558219|nr:hypothetical protein [Oceanicola sp. S124]
MPKDPACGNGPAMSRRSFAALIPVAGATALFPAPVNAASEIELLYLKWAKTRQRFNERDLDDEETDTLFRSLVELEDRISALPCLQVKDLACKVLIADLDGAMADTQFQIDLVCEARRLSSRSSNIGE